VRVVITVAIDADFLRAEIPGTSHRFDRPNRADLSSNSRGLQLDAVGAGSRLAYDPESFDPFLTGNVVDYLRLMLWSRMRRFPMGLLDRMDVRLTLAEYHLIPPDLRGRFEAALPRMRTRWWINDEPVR